METTPLLAPAPFPAPPPAPEDVKAAPGEEGAILRATKPEMPEEDDDEDDDGGVGGRQSSMLMLQRAPDQPEEQMQ